MASEQTAQTARAEAGAVTQTVREETKNVAQEAQQQAASALRKVQYDVRGRANEEATKFAESLHDTSRKLTSMAEAAGDESIASSVAHEGAKATERLASRLEDGGLDSVMADVRTWARRRPGAFLLGVATAGFVAGRLVRNMSAEGQPTPQGSDNGSRALSWSSGSGGGIERAEGSAS
jgi:hypothetical protein